VRKLVREDHRREAGEDQLIFVLSGPVQGLTRSRQETGGLRPSRFRVVVKGLVDPRCVATDRLHVRSARQDHAGHARRPGSPGRRQERHRDRHPDRARAPRDAGMTRLPRRRREIRAQRGHRWSTIVTLDLGADLRFPGGGGENRTPVRGFAGPCLNHSATPPRRGASLSAGTERPARCGSTRGRARAVSDDRSPPNGCIGSGRRGA
jgi:hypothetical protein